MALSKFEMAAFANWARQNYNASDDLIAHFIMCQNHKTVREYREEFELAVWCFGLDYMERNCIGR